MMIEAALALSRARSPGRTRSQALTAEPACQGRARKTPASQLTVAIGNGEPLAQHLPQIEARTGALTGAKALVRRQHPETGLIGSERFLKPAREMHLGPANDRIVREGTLADLATFRAAGMALPRNSVNASARRLRHAILVDERGRPSITPGDIGFELLGSTFLDKTDGQLIRTLDAFGERGNRRSASR